MSKFSDIKEFLQNKFHKNEELEPDDDDTSMAEGVNDKIHGVNKKVVYAILGTLVVAFISFTYFNSSDDTSKKQQQQKKQTRASAWLIPRLMRDWRKYITAPILTIAV